MLEKKIKKSLIETKEKKERLLIEEKIVKGRVLILFEGINSDEDFNKLSEKQKFNLSIKFLHEMSYLQNTGLINEQNFGDILKSLFGGLFGNVTQTIVEPFLSKLLVPIFGEGYLTSSIVSFLTKNPADVIKSFNDCRLLTKLIAESISEAIVMQLQNSKGLNAPGYIFIRNTMGDVLTGTEFISGIEKSLGNTICNMVGKFTDNAEKVTQKLKNTGGSVIPGIT
jgi:hypothetical protein